MEMARKKPKPPQQASTQRRGTIRPVLSAVKGEIEWLQVSGEPARRFAQCLLLFKPSNLYLREEINSLWEMRWDPALWAPRGLFRTVRENGLHEDEI